MVKITVELSGWALALTAVTLITIVLSATQ